MPRPPKMAATVVCAVVPRLCGLAEMLGGMEGKYGNQGCEKVILEVDSSSLKTLLESTDCTRSSISGLCSDISELGRSFIEFRVVWVGRVANSVAHCCASMVSPTDRSRF